MKAPVTWSLAITAPDHLALERYSVFADENADDPACRNHQVIWLREFRNCGLPGGRMIARLGGPGSFART
ncbi:hypothetical protein VHN57_01935 [Sphingobium sp. WW5]|uniref:hypothetical protein n=1 Tax=unclassified Sphingobium TaxID=2611147 RepID=UPI003C1AA6B8